jgi:hypothetical protein
MQAKQIFYRHILPYIKETNFGMSESEFGEIIEFLDSLPEHVQSPQKKVTIAKTPVTVVKRSKAVDDTSKHQSPSKKSLFEGSIVHSDEDDLELDFSDRLPFTSTQNIISEPIVLPPKVVQRKFPLIPQQKIVDYSRMDKKGRDFVQFRWPIEMASSDPESDDPDEEVEKETSRNEEKNESETVSQPISLAKALELLKKRKAQGK